MGTLLFMKTIAEIPSLTPIFAIFVSLGLINSIAWPVFHAEEDGGPLRAKLLS